MEFTKEQIDYLKEYFATYSNDKFVTYDEILNSFLEPKKKKFIIEINIQGGGHNELSKETMLSFFKYFGKVNGFTITELPEVFTREDMIEFAEYYYDSDTPDNHNECFDSWLSERKSK